MQRAIDERIQMFGPEHRQTISSRYNLGLIFRYQMKHVEAEATFRTVIEQQTKVLGPHYPDTLWTTRVLAHLLFDLKRPDEAKELCQKILAAPQPEHTGIAKMVTEQKQRTKTLLEQFAE